MGATWDEQEPFPKAMEVSLVDELVSLAEVGANESQALVIVKRWTEEHDRSSKALTRMLDVAFARFATAESIDVVFTVVGWLESSHRMWGPR